MRRILLALVLMLTGVGVAAAERVTLALSIDKVGIGSNFAGTSLTVFGVISPDASTVSRIGAYDAVVIVRGPPRTQVTRRLENVFGVWVNGPARTFVAAPFYLATLSSRPIVDITLPQVRDEMQIGFEAMRIPSWGFMTGANEEPEFRRAFIENRQRGGLFIDVADGVEFLAPNVFRARIPLPATIPQGFYAVEVKVLSDGFVVGQETARFEAEKQGFEALVFTASRNQPLLYGIATVFLAIATGGIASVVFRRN
jgi:uncharacterized protein (TIGR02186 family)